MSNVADPASSSFLQWEERLSAKDIPDIFGTEAGPAGESRPSGVSLADASERYFRQIRREIAPLLPHTASQILDVGAGVGATSAWLRTRYAGCRTVALEGNPALAADLHANCDAVHIVDLNDTLPDVGMPDLVLLLDVLEHLADPLKLLSAITSIMAPHATVIVSVPNIAHLSVSIPLLLRGEFTYRDAGILDRTHLRFFVRDSAIGLLNAAGLQVETGLLTGLDGPRTSLVDRLTFGRLRDRLAKQYILAGQSGGRGGQGAVRWIPVRAPRP